MTKTPLAPASISSRRRSATRRRFSRDLDAALGAGDIAAVLLRLEPADERSLINRAKAVAAVVQRRDIALLLDGHAESSRAPAPTARI